VINSSLPPDIMDFCNALRHLFCDSKDAECISYVLSAFLQAFGEKNHGVCNEIHSKGTGFLLGLFENSEGVVLLLLLRVTKRQSSLAPTVGAGDAGGHHPHGSRREIFTAICVRVTQTGCDISSLK